MLLVGVMRFFTAFLVSALFATVLMVSCGDSGDPNPEHSGLAGFTVEFDKSFDIGSEENRTPESREIRDGKIIAKINVTAIGYDKKRLENYNGTVEIRLLYGTNRGIFRTNLENGLLLGHEVEMLNCLDKDRVVVQEVVNLNPEGSSPDYVKTGKLGVSPEFYAENPSIVAIQGTISGGKGSPSSFSKRNLTLRGQTMVVTAVIEGGFYLTQVGATEYASLYLYSHSTPFVEDDSDVVTLPVGTLVESANGSISEFFGYTEMSFPTYTPVYEEKDGKKTIKVDISLIPDPIDVTSLLSNDNEMEKYEASIVTVKDVAVSNFNEHDSAFTEYSQFPLAAKSGGIVLAQTVYTVPSFNPVDEKHDTHRFNFTGILKQHTSARPSTWIIVPRNEKDIECLNCKQ